MIFQLLIDKRQSVSNLGDSILQFFLQREASQQRKEEFKQRQAEAKFEQEQQQAVQQNALSQLVGQALSGGLQSPAGQDVLGQVGNARIPFSQTLARAPGAATIEQEVQVSGKRAAARKRALAAAPPRSRPLIQASLDLLDSGQDPSIVNTLLNELKEDLDPSEAARLDRVTTTLQNEEARQDLLDATARRSSAAKLRGQFPSLANLPDEEVIDVAAAVAKEVAVPDKDLAEVALNAFINLSGRKLLNFKGEPITLFTAPEAFDIVETAIRAFRDPEFTIESFNDVQRSKLTIIAGLAPILDLPRGQVVADLDRVRNAVIRLLNTDFPGIPPKARIELFRQRIREKFKGDTARKDRNDILKAINEAEAAFVSQR